MMSRIFDNKFKSIYYKPMPKIKKTYQSIIGN